MLGIAIILNYISFSFGVPGQSVEITFDYIPILMVGFILGPLEGMLFGVIADSIIVLLNGWIWNFFLAIQAPIIGLFGALGGYIYQKNYLSYFSKKIKITLCDIFLIIIGIIGITLVALSGEDEFAQELVITSFVFIPLSILIINIIFYQTYRKESNQGFDILIISIFMIFGSRLINSWILTPIAMNVLYDYEFIASLLPRIVSTSFWGPINAILIFYILRGLSIQFSKLFRENKKWA